MKPSFHSTRLTNLDTLLYLRIFLYLYAMKSTSFILPKQKEELPLYLDGYFGQDILMKAEEMYLHIKQPLFKAHQTEINKRNLNNWVNVLDKKTSNSDRKLYSFSEYVWYKIVEQLREAGLSLEIIAQLKSEYLKPLPLGNILTKLQERKEYIEGLKIPKEQKEQLLKFLLSPQANQIDNSNEITLHDLIIMESLFKKKSIMLAVFTDGTFIIMDNSKIEFQTYEHKLKLAYQTHIMVSVTRILSDFILSDISEFIVPKLNLLTETETKLFELIRSGEYEAITIQFTDKQWNTLELKKSEDVKQKLIDIMSIGEFAHYTVKKHKGKITKIESTFKVKL